MLNILLMIILIIILIIIITLYIGITISLNYIKKGSSLEGCLKILILKKIKVYSLKYPSKKEKEEGESDGEKRDYKELAELLKPCANDIILFLKQSMKSLSIKKLENHIVFGAESYADTGKYIGIIWAVLSIVNNTHKNARLSAEPSFAGAVLDSKGVGDININILKLIVPTVKLISKKNVRKLIRGVLNG